MNAPTRTAANPLARLATTSPPMLGLLAGIAGRVAGAGALTFVALDESYDRTQAFAVAATVLTLASLIPLPRVKEYLPWLGASTTFFAGALLFNVSSGPLALACGAIAAVAASLHAGSTGRSVLRGVLTFFAGFGGVLAGVAVVVATVSG